MLLPPEPDHLSEEEAARRRDEVVKRMLATPPQPRKAKPGGRSDEPSLPVGHIRKA
jgi:hypothetical protein